ncbi:2-succinyl-6-hydroxy-2,4-cyclohexadiene-1-carboxylate synthase [Virgibacillus soli]|uniref:Putative 2-succinyl-6-hydroxy-2,4-cyclohexadiene-1-carboxylate synthase n=1 Tax=Paracerasibacillus soli TaxID=480284 RepID=A0ABU5CQW5_9BACI|nr:2-succinyl-6-hydroxy-2,4-cyclohexadiene-1-carboxylate synthase [Virgibacillus soli]MDY0408752.1 2-succinyl-6-hydroxy-2,4-cyclohexadiene-1-carboxylate synthase [Virgibacillus soli]
MKVHVGDSVYHCEIYGNQGETIVLFHGFTGSVSTWSTLIDGYQDRFRFVVIDLPGHGKTMTPTIKTMKMCCDDLAIIFQTLGLKNVHLLGYSMGGRTALSFAMLYPEYIKSFVLESASPGLKTKQERNLRIKSDDKLIKKMQEDGLVSFIDYWEGIPLFHTQQTLPKKVKEQIRQERLSQQVTGLIQSLQGMGTGIQPSWWNHLQNWKKPVLLVVGERDPKFVHINEEMSEKLKNSQLVIVKNVGHAIHVEDPQKFGKIVNAFILQNR